MSECWRGEGGTEDFRTPVANIRSGAYEYPPAQSIDLGGAFLMAAEEFAARRASKPRPYKEAMGAQ